MSENIVTYTGTIYFDIENKTNKHQKQSSWKKMAMVLIPGEITEYYSWFIQKRYNLILNKPLRNAHVSFINDAFNDLNNKTGSNEEKEILWNEVKNKWQDKEIDIVLNLDIQSDGNHWWLMVEHEYRKQLHGIREELGLGKPYYGLHLSIGYANERNIEHSEYINRLIAIDDIYK